MTFIDFTQKNNIAAITFNRPDKKNALTQDMYQDIVNALIKIEISDNIHVVIIKGNIDCFTSGNDLNDFLSSKLTKEHPVITFLYKLANFKKPLIAAVTGAAIGIGTTMLLHCDLVYCTPSTRFQLPFINLGLTPEAAISLLLPMISSHQIASELLLLGETFNAQKAKSLGFVNDIIETEDLFEHCDKIASTLANKPKNALFKTKELLKSHFSKKSIMP